MKWFFDMLYPRNCLGCGLSVPETFRYICWDCWTNTTHVEPPFCARCGDPVAGTVEHDFICYSCAGKTPFFDGARSAARYDGVVGEALRQLKYEQALWLVPDLAHIMHNCLNAEYPELSFDAVVPVPLFRVRRRERGFNQSGLLASALGRIISCPVGRSMLRRNRPTATQTNLTAKERISNVGHAFEHGKRRLLANRRILLVDDVMTTGATVNACARALKKGGAASVHVITAARG